MINKVKRLSCYIRDSCQNLLKDKGDRSRLVYLHISMLEDRHLYLLAEFFIQAGCFVYMTGKLTPSSYYVRDPYFFYIYESGYIKHLNEIPRSVPQGSVLCTDQSVEDAVSAKFDKVLHMSYDIRPVRDRCRQDRPILPYLMHPNVYHSGEIAKIETFRETPKSIRVFFAGNLKTQYAHRTSLLQDYIPRREAVRMLQEHFGDRVRVFASRERLLDALEAGQIGSSIVVFDATHARLGRREWFPVLARCRFFLGLPGVVMPVCHNVVEAAAIGAVPIFSYGHLFSPAWTHNENCLLYHSAPELFSAVETALKMDAGDYATIRQNCIAHFERHIKPERCLESLLARPERVLSLLFPAEFVSEKVAGRPGKEPGHGNH